MRNAGKQRKLLHNAPAHIRHKLMAAPLSPELISSKGAKTLPVRKGDTVRVMRGDHKGFEGKISRVDLKKYRVYVEGLTREKVDGTTISVPIHPSKVLIKNLNLDDKWRKKVVERKPPITKKKETTEKEISKRTVEKPVSAKKKPAAARRAKAKAGKPVAARKEKPVQAEAEKPVEAKEEKPVAEMVTPEEKLPEKKPKPKAAKPRPLRKAVAEAEEKTKSAEEVKPAEEIKPSKTEEKPKSAPKTTAKRKTPSKAKGGT